MIDRQNLDKLRRDFEEGKNKQAFLAYADTLRRSKQYQQSLAVCLEGLEKDSLSLAGRALLSRIYYDMGRYEKSIAEVEKILSREPQAMQSRMLLVKALIKRRMLSEADKELQVLINFIPGDARLELLSKEIQRIKNRTTMSGNSGSNTPDEMEIRSVSGIQNKIIQVKKSLRKSPFVERIGLLSEFENSPAENGFFDSLKRLIDELKKTIGNSGFGNIKRLQFDLDSGIILLYQIEGDFFFVQATSNCKIGRLRYEIEQALE